jgi:AraC-like DNA-binding protein
MCGSYQGIPRVRDMKARATAMTRMPSTMGLSARLAGARARARGVALRPLLEKAGLTAREFADARVRLPTGNQIVFLNLVAEALADDMLGLSLALDYEMRRGGMFYYVLASSATLMDLLERGARFTAIVNEGVVQELIDGRRIGFALRYTGVKRQDDRHQIEFWLASLLRICRHATGRQLKPSLVRLSHYRRKGHGRFSRFMGCDVEFGAPRDEILFPREAGQLRVLNADPYLNRLLVEICEQTLARRRRATGSFAARVENALGPLLPSGKARLAHIAAEFGMSQRTFARRLADEDLTFSQLLDRLRVDLARRYLLNDKLPISKVAWLLGYKEVGAFSHAFRRWTGKSPSQVARQGQ